MYRARSGFSAAIALAIGIRAGLTPVVVFPAGSGESANTTNFQSPDMGGVVGPAVTGVVWTTAGDGLVHPHKLTASITIRHSVNVNNRIRVYSNPAIKKAVIFFLFI